MDRNSSQDTLNSSVRYWYLSEFKLFRKLSRKELHELNVLSSFRCAMKNEVVYFPDEPIRKVYFIKKGFVKIGYHDKDGNEVTLDILKRGDIFGEITFDEDHRSEEFAVAVTNNTTLCNFNITDLENILERNPRLAISLTRKIGEQKRLLTRRLANIIFKDARTRITEFFRGLADEENLTSRTDIHIPNNLTHQDVADLNGMSRQTATVIINQLKRENKLFFNHKEIVIPSLDQ